MSINRCCDADDSHLHVLSSKSYNTDVDMTTPKKTNGSTSATPATPSTPAVDGDAEAERKAKKAAKKAKKAAEAAAAAAATPATPAAVEENGDKKKKVNFMHMITPYTHVYLLASHDDMYMYVMYDGMLT